MRLGGKNSLVTFLILCPVVLLLSCPIPASTQETETGIVGKTLAERFSWDVRGLSYGVIQGFAGSSQNPSNNFLQIPRYVANVELRPDMRLDMAPLDLIAKPRARIYYRDWQDGSREGDSQWDSDVWVNEWLARLEVRPNLFVSYGRENLQWGPSLLYSPSNPFFRDNGRRNPYVEVPGMDFGRVVWIPRSEWTLSFIANTDEGANTATGPGRFLSSFPSPPFRKAYSVKVDYTGRQNYASLILSHREDSENIAGFYGGWTISDALRLHCEGSISRGAESLYPGPDGTRFGSSMQNLHEHAVYPAVLIGGAYTFEAGGTLTIEYTYYSPGYGGSDADEYYALRRKAAGVFSLGGPASATGQKVLGQTVSNGLRLMRQNYALFQYTHNNIADVFDCSLRWTQNIDDRSGQFTSVLAYSLGRHAELFSVNTITIGGKNTEFGSIVRYQLMFGVKYTF
jgi:hypothetical protein